MRLIDADALIEAIKNMSQRYCDCKDCDGRGADNKSIRSD